MTTATETTENLTVLKMLDDPTNSIGILKQVLSHILSNSDDESDAALHAWIKKKGANVEDLKQELISELKQKIAALEQGPVRPGMFLRNLEGRFGVGHALEHRVEIILNDGSSVMALLPEPDKIGKLRRGDTVLLDAQARVVIASIPTSDPVGDEAKLVRRVGPDKVEVEIEHQGVCLLHAGADLVEGLDRGDVLPGHMVIVCPQRRTAFCGVPPEDGRSHFEFLDKDPVPDVSVDRDIASPSPFIARLTDHVKREMLMPELGRQYRLNRASTMFLSGVSGSGKTLNILGFHRQVYELMSDITGIPVDELPPRVIRFSASKILSKWYGESEQRIGKVFDEVEALTAERVVGRDGIEYELPVIVIAEEIDGLTRERGSSHDAVDDRVLTTILQRLDTTAKKLRESLVIMLFTSNVPDLMDPAFIRRAGAMVEHFGRLDRRSFVGVLTKKTSGMPFVPEAGAAGSEAIAGLAAWIYGANSDTSSGLVELTYAGSTQPQARGRRDFLTGALVERAVQQAANEACEAQQDGVARPGLSTASLARALQDQVQSIVQQLTEHNVRHYLDVPQGVRVAVVRQIPDQNPIPTELLRA